MTLGFERDVEALLRVVVEAAFTVCVLSDAAERVAVVLDLLVVELWL